MKLKTFPPVGQDDKFVIGCINSNIKTSNFRNSLLIYIR